MIDHASLPVSDLARSKAFYEALLAPLGYVKMVDVDGRAGFGKRFPEIWINERKGLGPISDGMHLGLRAKGEDVVRAFHAAALANGGRDDGAPGPRQAAMTTYYAAFVRDPDGNKLEAASFPVTPAGGFLS